MGSQLPKSMLVQKNKHVLVINQYDAGSDKPWTPREDDHLWPLQLLQHPVLS